ncbi:Serine/threonine protein kinase [Nannocystis exedens]|uniref:Serine/threonine protein kinase n=1 Tax=Nannocystis exedens TaxID=54 RepID=A0A1I1X5W2_9BACT|nr:serine/threonine protein kinase [Nannocystis exedens]SFE02591.1 Serine/threonine protein kinase [Nannocystis exedens]
MADEDKGRGQSDDKGRTVFGIGLPASVQAATRAAPAASPPPPPVPRPAPPVKIPAKPEDEDTMRDVRDLTRPDDKRVADEKRTIVARPGQLIGAAASQAAAERPVSDHTVPDIRAVTGQKRDTGEFTPPAIANADTHLELRTPVKLTAGKPIPGTRYKLLRWLGEGGMGVVYEAEHIDIERRVALKILRAELSLRSDTAQVFRDEARAATRAGSKNIVEIFDFGELPDGRLFFCMELLNGIDLASQVETEIEFDRLIAVLRQVCKGLGMAHKAGIVHRDIKPENIILVTHEGRRDMAKIVDFGVSAMLSNDRGSGPIAGTPAYMPPEQINNTDFDGRLDMYAIGCVMYELLVGHPPFVDDNLAEVLLAHIKLTPPLPSQIKPERNIPKALEDVVMRCLAKSPADRYANMAELEAALCEAQIAARITTEWDDLPLPDIDPERRAALLARMPGSQSEQAEKRRWVLPVVAAVGAAVVTAVVLMLTSAPEVTPEEQEQIEKLSRIARQAASIGHYVNLPEDGGPTALLKVKELEAVEGSGERLADERGEELRKEFSNQLLTIGDKFWDTEGTRSLSRDYYAWALAFDPKSERALTRAARSQAEIDDYVKRAEAGTLSPGEKASGEIAVALIQPDVKKREASFKKAIAKARTEAPLSAQTAILDVARGAGVAVEPEAAPPTEKEPEAEPPKQVEAPPEPAEPEAVETPEPSGAKPKSGKGGKKREQEDPGDDELPDAPVKRDPAKATEIAGQGKAALASGRRDEAESLFNQAISYDRRNAEALIGLSDIYFDRGSADKAQRFAEKAVAVAPNNGSYRIKLGDAYYNALRYRDALLQYEKAQELGDAKAAQRISKVKSKLGG